MAVQTPPKPKSSAPPSQVQNTRALAARLSDISQDWKRLQSQKHRHRGGVESRVLLNTCMWYGEHASQQAADAIVSRPIGNDEDKNRLNLVFNMIRKLAKKRIGRVLSVGGVSKVTPDKNDPRAWAQADVVTKLDAALDRKLRERSKRWLRLKWMVIGGVAIEHVPWVPDAVTEPTPVYTEDGELVWRDEMSGLPMPQSQVEQLIATQGRAPESFTPMEDLKLVGDVGSDIYSPLNFFIDSSVPTVAELACDQACYILEVKTHGWIADNFGSDAVKGLKAQNDLSIVRSRLIDRGPTLAGMALKDLIPAIQGHRGPDDPPVAIVATRYQKPHREFPHGRREIFVPYQKVLDDYELPYEEIPVVDYHWEPTSTSFWSGDYVTDLVPAQKFLNRRMSQMGEAANNNIYEMLLLGPELDRDDLPTDYPGVVADGLNQSGEPQVQTLQRASLPGWFLESIKLVIGWMNEMGGSDVFSKQGELGQMRGPLAVPMLQEIIDSEDGPLYEHLAEQLGRVKQMRINRVKQFYPPIRTLHYTSRSMKDEVLVFHTDEVLRAGVEYSISIDPASLMPELATIREARVREQLNSPLSILYMNPRTGQLDPSRIAKALKYGDFDNLDRANTFRKLAGQLIERLWHQKPVPQVMEFWDLEPMMDELEQVMSTTEWIDASPIVQQAFVDWYSQFKQILQQRAEQQQASMESTMMQGAVAQATQQAAAKAAGEAVDAAMQQITAQGSLGTPAETVTNMRTQIEQLLAAKRQDRAAQGSGAPAAQGV